MKKLTKKEKIIIGASIAVGTGLAVLGVKQKMRIDALTNKVNENSNDVCELIGYVQRLDPLMPDVIEVIDRVLYPNRAEGGK